MGSLWLLACARHAREPSFVPLPEAPAAPAPVPAAILQGETWVDAELGLTLAAPPGWVVEPGVHGEEVRLLLHEDRLDGFVGAVAHRPWPPAPRADCTWTFRDHGRLAGLEVEVGTCTQDDGVRTFAWWWPSRPGHAWELALLLPPDRLHEADAAARAVLSRIRVNE